MDESNEQDVPSTSESGTQNDNDSLDILGFDSDRPSQRVFKLFGYELIAPTGMKNPGVIYLLFIIVNLIIFLYLRTRL
tara:strand:+ start:240 stop:473 length:234 start_codon:yes stop_codon:yes gene_type:complete